MVTLGTNVSLSLDSHSPNAEEMCEFDQHSLLQLLHAQEIIVASLLLQLTMKVHTICVIAVALCVEGADLYYEAGTEDVFHRIMGV